MGVLQLLVPSSTAYVDRPVGADGLVGTQISTLLWHAGLQAVI